MAILQFSKKYLLIFFSFTVLCGLFFLELYNAEKYKKLLGENEALLILDYGNGKKRWFKGEVVEEMTVLDVFTTASQAGNFQFTAGSYLASLDGLSNNGKTKWQCYLNNKEIKDSLSQTIVKAKDKIFCRYR